MKYPFGQIQRDSFITTLISFAGAALGYVNKVFLFTNFLKADQVGLANLLVTIAVIYAQLSALGAYNIIWRFFPYFRNESKKHQGFLLGILSLSLAGFALTSLLFLMLQKPFQSYYAQSSPLLVEYAWYLIPLAFGTLMYQLFESYLRAMQRNILPTVANELVLRIMVTLSISLYALGLVSFQGFVLTYVVANCIPALIVIGHTARIGQLFLKPLRSVLARRLGRIILVFGLFSLLNNLSMLLLVSIDSLMVAGMINLAAAGIYTTMVYVSSVMLIPYRALIKVSGPQIGSLWKEKAMDRMKALYRQASEGSLVVGAGLFLLIWVNLDAIFSLMPGDYSAGRYVFLLLGLGKLFDMASGINGSILLTSRKYRYDLLFTLGLVVITWGGNRLLIPLMGINGAALASMLSLILFNLTRILFIRYHFAMQPFQPRQLIMPLIMGMIMGINILIPYNGKLLIDLPLRSVATALVYLPLIWMFRLSPDFNSLAKVFFSRLKRKR